MKAYLPVAATTGEYDLLRMLLALLEADTIFRYLEGRSAWESKTALAMVAQKQITDFLSTESELFALIEEELGPQESPFLEEAYREQLERFAKYGL
jgi:hypothetical protein